jgi:uncharacterized protein YbaP (TraB family)
MKNIIPRLARLLAMALALFATCAPAIAREQRHTAPVSAKTAAVQSFARPALWMVKRGEATIYLFGTVHALPANVNWLHGAVEQAFKNSNSLVTEIIEKSPEDMRKIVFEKAILPEGKLLRDDLPESTRRVFEKALKNSGLPVESFDHFRPWYAAVALSTLPLMKSGFDPANGVDSKLSAMAQAEGRPHEALETAEYQLGLFNTLPIDLQKSYLKEVATGAPHIASDLGAMIAAWKAGNAPRLAKLMNADEKDARLAETLLIGRNRNWAGWIKDRLGKPGTVFVAVGAGHLAGRGSVQDQLKAMGITAIRVQ